MARPFEEGNPGRPKGAINKSTKLVKEAFAEAFAEMQNDPDVKLLSWGRDNPTEFYKLASKLIPVQLDASINASVSLLSLDPLSSVDDSTDNSTTEDSGA